MKRKIKGPNRNINTSFQNVFLSSTGSLVVIEKSTLRTKSFITLLLFILIRFLSLKGFIIDPVSNLAIA